MIWFYVISLLLFLLWASIFRSVKESDSYLYREENAHYWRIPIWVIILLFIVWLIPYGNLIIAIIILLFQILVISTTDCLKFVPKEDTKLGKLLKFLTKEI